jgi:hypothetical protein
MSKDMAELLGLDLNKDIDFAFGIGGKVKSLQTAIEIILEQKHEKYSLSLPIKVILDDYSFPLLLGRVGFFDEFIVPFDQPQEKVMLKKVSKKIF